MTAVQFRNTDVRLSDALAATAMAIRGSSVTLRELIAHVGEQGLLVFSAILAMPFLLPVSLPFMSTVLGLPMLMIGFAVVVGRLPWLPERLLNHALPSETVRSVLERGRRVSLRFEHLLKPRLLALTGAAAVNSVHGVALVFTVLLLMAPLPFVPLANTLPGIAIILVCLGIAERDGLLLIVGYLFMAISAVYILTLLWLVLQAERSAEGIIGSMGAYIARLFGG